ncbi:hypothetical protein ES288_A02G069400v1 [Gossypium darwinii]|uniref:Uncharacterized protein n=2 Tax=Gossypium TaxID=3633 RepID=A0A5D2RGQ0_GOSTO|nr:hypothetical protein ES288_A02G069400v1 [Gossypium darwinii]TYI39010.1 hypothetical protein ES332_A02G069600v1 [Gossypium tomentosum]
MSQNPKPFLFLFETFDLKNKNPKLFSFPSLFGRCLLHQRFGAPRPPTTRARPRFVTKHVSDVA